VYQRCNVDTRKYNRQCRQIGLDEAEAWRRGSGWEEMTIVRAGWEDGSTPMGKRRT
jgi:hypothetical protein